MVPEMSAQELHENLDFSSITKYHRLNGLIPEGWESEIKALVSSVASLLSFFSLEPFIGTGD